jgi:hypothetical protein
MSKIAMAVLAQTALLILYVLSHLMVSRYLRPEQRWRAKKRIFFPVLVLAAVAGYFLNLRPSSSEPMAAGLFAALVLIWLIHIGYLTVYAVFDRSISLRVLIEIYSGPRNMTFGEIETRYDPDAAFQRRLEILVESGFLKLENGRYKLLKKGRRTGTLIGILKEIYRTGEGG